MDHDEAIAGWQKHAEDHDQQNYEFVRSLRDKDPDEVDAQAQRLHKETFEIVDCTRCANCCKTLEVRFSQADVERIAIHRNVTPAELIANFLEPLDKPDLFRVRNKPCPFLQDDNLCSIYEVRPINCHEYPYTDLEGFAYRTLNVVNNALVCPATFWIVEKMRAESET